MSPFSKSFDNLQDDYRFFEEHVSEREGALQAWGPWLHAAARQAGCLRFLDFGAGSGSFTEMVLRQLGRAPDQIRIELVEPVDAARECCVQVCGPYTDSPVAAVRRYEDLSLNPCSLIICHHVLYYVDRLEETLQALIDRLDEGGVMLAVVAAGGSGPGLLQEQLLGMAGLPPQYRSGVDIRDTLMRMAPDTQIVPFWSEMRMADTRANRDSILRFLIGEFPELIPWERALGVFDPFVSGSEVIVPSQELALATGQEVAPVNPNSFLPFS